MKRLPKPIARLARWLLGCLLIVFMLRWFEHSQVYHPDRVLTASGAELGRPFENVNFKATDGVELHGWFFPANTDSPRARTAVLVCHGNAGNISHRLDLCQALLATGVNVFLFDYRGFGRSAGQPSEEGTYLDAQAAHRWLQSKGFKGKSIIAFGESLGGGVASELAVREAL
ncbi:MAG: alpha/beta hydrolase, partial [Verrucomicrobia bacterium]